ncbi:MAG: CRISPR-associated helicase Cas3' [Chthonomonadales bacterium]
MNEEPLAKSSPSVTLAAHTADVVHAVKQLVQAVHEPLSGLVPPYFTDMLVVAAVFHDLGKAAEGFQRSLKGAACGASMPWGYRHEALSASILLKSGLADKYGLELFAAVLTHHKTLDDEDLTRCTAHTMPQTVWCAIGRQEWKERVAELRRWWCWITDYLTTGEAAQWLASLPCALPSDPSELPDLYDATVNLRRKLSDVGDIESGSIPWILARGFLMAGDHLASSGKSAPIERLPSHKILPPEGFQKRIRSVRISALLEAPTGSGKTEAALHWALANRAGGERIIYILPYQASINKMGERLSALFGIEQVGILHHNAQIEEFQRYFNSPTDNYDQASDLARKRVEDTRKFYRPIKVMTPYQVLKLLFGTRYFEIGLAELVGALVIFDEIHAYDPHIAALIEIAVKRLMRLNVRFLFMSATFPDFLKERIQKVLGAHAFIGLDENDERDARLMNTARHRLRLLDGNLEDAVPAIVKAAQSKSVLVACNRVTQAQEIYRMLKDKISSIALLHSRYMPLDRHRIENGLVAYPDDPDPARQQMPNVSVVVATQVVEVSLNISFDTIYTEAAPVDALLQRFGRVNRLNQNGAPVPVFVCTGFERDRVRHIYDPRRIELTLASAPEGEALFPSVEKAWVNAAYCGGYTDHEQRKYENAYKAFDQVVRGLRPAFTGSDADFYELFNNYNVVPARYAHTYRRAAEERRFYDAAGYIVPLSTPAFQTMRAWAQFDKVNHVYALDRRYDRDLGLLNEPEVDRSYLEEALDDQCL